MRPPNLVVVLLLTAFTASTQETRGDISGRVADSQGGLSPGASVAVTNLATSYGLSGYRAARASRRLCSPTHFI